MSDPISWTLAWPHYLAALGFGYLLGSIPFGLILTRLAGKGDIRSIGSGNIGTTNVLRTGSKKLAAMTLLGDMVKGTIAVIAAYHFAAPATAQTASLIAGLGAFFGHLFPIWLKFKGGKGVATYLGILLGIYWPAALIFAAIWIAVAWLTRYSSLAALIASCVTPPALALAFQQWSAAELMAFLTVMLWGMHHQNIRRLLSGTENRIGSPK